MIALTAGNYQTETEQQSDCFNGGKLPERQRLRDRVIALTAGNYQRDRDSEIE